MSRLCPLLAAALLCIAAPSTAAGVARQQPAPSPRQIAPAGQPSVFSSSSSSASLHARETAGPDTFDLYGGPDEPTEGKFQLDDGVTPDWGDGWGVPPGGRVEFGPGAWTPVDLTDHPVYWHVDTFNAENLNGNGAGNRAMWCGVAEGDPLADEWKSPPGYGNNWDTALLYESGPLVDPAAGQIVALDFFFNHDTEPGFDFFSVQYDSAGTWTTVYSTDGSNADSLARFNPPGVRFSAVQAAPIRFVGGDYGGDGADRIRIRLRVTSDGVWSDEDGSWPTLAGAAQVDDITLATSQGNFTEGFEGSAPWLFSPDKSPFAGDFAEAHPRIADIDPCRDNPTPVLGFVDFDQVVRNGPALDGVTIRTGGSTSPGVSYGIAGNFVTNYTGGLSLGQVGVLNEIWSPDIQWDLPGADDDAVDISGSFLSFTVWRHLPLPNGYFYIWHVRSALPGEAYGRWADDHYVRYGSVPAWMNVRYDTSGLIQAGAERVQLALAAWHYGVWFGLPGEAATPSPMFDNVRFAKHRLAGPVISAREVDLAQDGFPPSGSIDMSTAQSRDALDIPFDMARDVNTGQIVNEPGDSVVIDVVSIIPGAHVTDIRMVWAKSTNRAFEDALRAPPDRTKDENVVAGPVGPYGTIWTGEVVAEPSTTSAGYHIADRFFLDLPDRDFLYPGETLHYFFRASDSDGRTTTLPADTTDFLEFGFETRFDRTFTIRGLPSVNDVYATQPTVLVVNEAWWESEAAWSKSMWRMGYGESLDYDVYTVRAPGSAGSNGIGSAGAHGAAPEQLAGYRSLFYLFGTRDVGALSNGDPSVGGNDKSNDLDLLEQWHSAPGNRSMAYFGDNLASTMAAESPEALNYLTSIMGVEVVGPSVRPVIGGQTAPLVVPDETSSYARSFWTDYIAYGGCPSVHEFDWIEPLGGAEAGHLFTDAAGTPLSVPGAGAASIVNPTAQGIQLTFPYGWAAVYNPIVRAQVRWSARDLLLQDILGLIDAPVGFGPGTDAPSARVVQLGIAPNPFNPRTTVRFTAAAGARGSVRVYDLRGQLVRALHEGEFVTQEFVWDGRDDSGASVASGVYLVRGEVDGTVLTRKVALVR